MSKEKPFFDPEWFQLSFDAILQNAVNQVGNVGQGVIVLQAADKVKGILINLGLRGGRKKVNRRVISAAFQTVMGPEKYRAVSLIVETAATELELAMDDATGGDNKAAKLFHKIDPESYVNTPPSPAALTAASRLGFISGKLN